MSTIKLTPNGLLFEGDCMDMLKSLPSGSVDLAFADPPFNLGKKYSSKINDDRADHEYLAWCETWLDEMVRVLKPGGTLMHWNLPKWNLPLGAHLMKSLTFRHWIAVDIKYSLPVAGRLYPSHYSLAYFIKGQKPNVFHPDRIPIACCRHCGGELKDYGGYKAKMNPLGVNISDVWTDIPPVRHVKYKKREENALSLKLMDRIVALCTDPGDMVIDPFGGSGTTYVAAELTGRKWIGSEMDCSAIIERFKNLEADRDHLEDIHRNKNTLFTKADLKKQKAAGRKLSPHYRIDSDDAACDCADAV